MHPEISKLLDLQARDIELLTVDTRLHELDTELAVLDADLHRVRDGVTAAQRSIETESKRRDELEAKIESHRNHQEKRKEKLEFMKTQKEVAGLMAEIDLARGILSAEENEWLKSSEQVGQLEMKKIDAEQQVASVLQVQEAARAAIDDKKKGLDAERKEILSRREVSAREVKKPLLQHYDKLRTSGVRRATVVVPLSGPACGACFTTIPVSRRTLIRTGAVIEGCESCGVILYSTE